MGLRRFAAERLVGFLVDHGDLHARIVREAGLGHCVEPDPVAPARPWEVLALPPPESSEDASGPLPFATAYHPALLFAATLLLSWHARRTVKSRREWRLASLRRSNISSRLESLCQFLASSSLRLAAVHLACSAMPHDDFPTSFAEEWGLDDSMIDALEGLRAASPLLFAASLWSMLGCLAVASSIMAWGVLDPRNEWVSLAQARKTWKRRHVRDGFLAAASAGVVLGLAHADLPLFRQLLRGDVRIDLGLSNGLIEAIKQVSSSFVAFCIYNKLLAKEERLPDGTKIPKKAGRPAINPEVIRRMSALAIEARDRVKDPRRALRRTYSEGNFGTLGAGSGSPLTPPGGNFVRRHSERLPPRSPPRRPKEEARSNPLLDIHYAGPNLSPAELIAKLREGGRIRRSVSMVHLTPPRMPMLSEEEEKAADAPGGLLRQ